MSLKINYQYCLKEKKKLSICMDNSSFNKLCLIYLRESKFIDRSLNKLKINGAFSSITDYFSSRYKSLLSLLSFFLKQDSLSSL